LYSEACGTWDPNQFSEIDSVTRRIERVYCKPVQEVVSEIRSLNSGTELRSKIRVPVLLPRRRGEHEN
jgi:hypothetical protein